MKTYLCQFRPTRPTFPGDATIEEGEVVGAHFDRLHADSLVGKVRLAGRTLTDQPVGLVVFHAESDESAVDYIANDPCVLAKLFNYEIHPYAIAIWANEST